MKTKAIILILTLLAATARAETVAYVLQLKNGSYVAVIDNKVLTFDKLILVEQPDPRPTPSPVSWKVTGLHVLVVDDENLRGRLPQSQVNIFSSKPLKDWLTANAVAHRFSSNDSLKPGEPARELERPEFVAGWDLVSSGGVKLPAWIVSDGKKQIIGPLPTSVDDVLEKLKELK